MEYVFDTLGSVGGCSACIGLGDYYPNWWVDIWAVGAAPGGNYIVCMSCGEQAEWTASPVDLAWEGLGRGIAVPGNYLPYLPATQTGAWVEPCPSGLEQGGSLGRWVGWHGHSQACLRWKLWLAVGGQTAYLCLLLLPKP